MGTYTTNYNLYIPTVGEQGWGTLVNGNFTTIDTTMKSLSNRITAVESEVNGALSCTSVTTSGKVTANGGVGTTSLTTSSTITSTGLITANGGVKGICYGKLYVTAKTTTTKKNGDITYATINQQNMSATIFDGSTNSSTITVANVSKISLSYPYQLCPGVFIPSSSYFTDSVTPATVRTLTMTLTINGNAKGTCYGYLYVNGQKVKTLSVASSNGTVSTTYSVSPGQTVYVQASAPSMTKCTVTATIPAQNYYINVV